MKHQIMPKLFISYARPDEEVARRLYEALRDRGYEPWLDTESLLPGQDWEMEIRKAIRETDFVIVLLSHNSVDRRGFFQKEIRLALDTLQTVPPGQIYLMPMRLDDCKTPEPLTFIHYFDLLPNWDSGLIRLCEAIRLQHQIRQDAKDRAQEDRTTDASAYSILLVNDEPAAMSRITDQWKLVGFRVDFAFAVEQAIRLIDGTKPSVVVSDLSHFAYGEQITDRAAFEILEWSKDSGRDLKVIVTCADLTDDRRLTAKKLGAVGICNNVCDLMAFLRQATGLTYQQMRPQSRLRDDPYALWTIPGW